MHRDQQPPPALVDAVALALRDLVAPGEEVDVSYGESDVPAAWIVVVEFADGTRTGFEVLTCGLPVERLAATADHLQQALIDHVGEARPACPHHAHPLVATVVDQVAVWACPQDTGTWPIGSLGPPRAADGASDGKPEAHD
jgi:hypothetical protein